MILNVTPNPIDKYRQYCVVENTINLLYKCHKNLQKKSKELDDVLNECIRRKEMIRFVLQNHEIFDKIENKGYFNLNFFNELWCYYIDGNKNYGETIYTRIERLFEDDSFMKSLNQQIKNIFFKE